VALIARDFAPKRPTLERAVGAAPPLLLAAGLLAGLAVPAWRDAAAHRGEQALGAEVFLVVMMLFVTRVSAIEDARGVFRFLQLAAMAWYVFAFGAVLVLIGCFTGAWTPLAAGLVLVAGRAHTLLSRRDFVQREILFARSVADFLLLWVAAFASFPVAMALGPAGGKGGYAAFYFALVGLLDLFGVLVPEPAPTAHAWWERLLHPMAGPVAAPVPAPRGRHRAK
jgi:hypothetical protein